MDTVGLVYSHVVFQVREEERPEGVTSKVVIRKVNRKDSSEFQCDASNKFGNSKRRIKLIVQVILNCY